MRLEEVTRSRVHVVLSRRNLAALLAKVDGHPPNSQCTLSYWAHNPGGPIELVVTAEPDEVHYSNPERDVPGYYGPMHPETEKAIER